MQFMGSNIKTERVAEQQHIDLQVCIIIWESDLSIYHTLVFYIVLAHGYPWMRI